MRAKPAKDDLRHIPVRYGGTGGFGRQQYGHESPRRFSALSPRSKLSKMSRNDTDSIVSKAAIRTQARIVAIKSLDALANRVPSMDNGELVSAANVAGKLAGMTQPNKGQGVTVNIGQLHLAALQARKALSNGSGTAITLGHNDTVDATVLDEVTPSKDMASNEIGDDYIPAT